MRHLLSAALLLLAMSVADAQSVRKGPPIDLVAAPRLAPAPVLVPFPSWGVPSWGGYWGGFYYPGVYQPQVVVVPQQGLVTPPNPARVIEDADRAAVVAPATLTLELPAVADLWLDDKKQPNSAAATQTLVSPALPIGQEYTFRLRARWIESGITYEAEKTTTVRAGERGKVAVYAGTVVK